MKRALILGVTALFVVLAATLSRSQTDTKPPVVPPVAEGELQVQVDSRNPWTNLRLNNNPDEFRFAIVSDRTGGHRARIFSQAVEKLNLLQPEFVLSVGDLIEGYTEDPQRIENEWKEFQGFVSKLKMPFFYVAGNHDLTNNYETKVWKEKFGRRYYHFAYRNVLFLLLCSEDPLGHISTEQIAYAKSVLEQNKNVRWTIVSLHKPLWSMNGGEKTGWLDVEKELNGRSYTVFAGHVHVYKKFVRQGQNYYQLATTGGASKMRGVEYGEFDHFTWVTMKKTGPVLANIMLDGIYPEDMKAPITDEPGVREIERKVTYPAKGTVYLEGTPATGTRVVFHYHLPDADRYITAGDSIVQGDGSFSLSTYTSGDGAPAGEYAVTLEPWSANFDEFGKTGPSLIPEKYTKVATTPLRATVKSGKNEFVFELKK